MAKIKKVPVSETRHQYLFNCPGCDQEHAFNDVIWTWNENYDRPTLYPSYLMHGYKFDKDHNSVPFVCHSYIENGMIKYLTDCTHSLAGQTVELPEI